MNPFLGLILVVFGAALGIVWMKAQNQTSDWTMPESTTEEEIAFLPDSQLGQLPAGHPLRWKLENELVAEVRSKIACAWKEGMSFETKVSVVALWEALRRNPPEWEKSFAAWNTRRGKLIGTLRANSLARWVCQERNFTWSEASLLYGQHHPSD